MGINLGINMIAPTMTEKAEVNNTAAAAISLIFLAKGWKSGETRSIVFSMTVFQISIIKTKKHTKSIHNHSGRDKDKNKEIKIMVIDERT